MNEESLMGKISDVVCKKFQECHDSSVFSNWKFLSENIRDAVDQRWRPNEVKTRSLLYFGVLRSVSDGLFEGATEAFGAADPFWMTTSRVSKYDLPSDKVMSLMNGAWDDANGTSKWLLTWKDAVDYGMGVSYVYWDKVYAVSEVPKLKPLTKDLITMDFLDWDEESMKVLDSAQIKRIHPLNWRGDLRNGNDPMWEGVLWEWCTADLVKLVGNTSFRQDALARAIEKAKKGDLQKDSTYYNTVDEYASGGSGGKFHVKEYWGPLSEVEGREEDYREYMVLEVGGEIIRISENKLVCGSRWRAIHRTVLHPSNDYPMGHSLLSPNLPHQRAQNWMRNLVIDGVIAREHLGLAYWPDTIVNVNDLMNPEGAQGLLALREDTPVDKLPRYFADSRSGTLYDVLQMDGIVDRDRQITGLNDQALGMGGGGGGTATESNYLAKSGSRRMRSAFVWGVRSGLQPMGRHILALTLRNKGAEVGFSPKDMIGLIGNDVFQLNELITTDMIAVQSNLANFSSIAMSTMASMAQKDGSQGHVVAFLRDLYKAYKLPLSRLDKYFPEQLPAQLNPQQGGAVIPQEGEQNAAAQQGEPEVAQEELGMSPEQVAQLEA